MITEANLLKSRIVFIDYTNWRGERAWRRIIPNRISFATTPHHKEAQWVLVALDVDKAEDRAFAVLNIHAWSESKPQ